METKVGRITFGMPSWVPYTVGEANAKHEESKAAPEKYTEAERELRDWFAGQAIRARWGDGTAMTPEQAAEMACQLADAMMAERSK